MGTLTTDGSSPKHNNRVIEPKIKQLPHGFNKGKDLQNCPTITTGQFVYNNVLIEPCAAAMRGRNPENPSDRRKGIPTQQRIEFGGDTSNALTTVQKDSLIAEPNLKRQMCNELIADGKIKENDVIRHSYTRSRMNGEMKDIQQNNLSPTIDTRADCLGVCTRDERLDLTNCRVRKLTEKECGRLMGVKDEDIDKLGKNLSRSAKYHCFGDSLVTCTFMALLGRLLNVDYKAKINEVVADITKEHQQGDTK